MDRIGREILPLPDEVTLRRCMKANWINGDLLRLVRTESVLGAEFVQAVCVCVCETSHCCFYLDFIELLIKPTGFTHMFMWPET